MKAGSRPQYYRIRRMVQMVREGAETGYLPNSSDFIKEFEVSRRTVARDLDFLRDEERAPLAYDDARHGFRLTDETYTLPPVRISRKEAVRFGLARKLLAHYEGTPLTEAYPLPARRTIGEPANYLSIRAASQSQRTDKPVLRRPREEAANTQGAFSSCGALFYWRSVAGMKEQYLQWACRFSGTGYGLDTI